MSVDLVLGELYRVNSDTRYWVIFDGGTKVSPREVLMLVRMKQCDIVSFEGANTWSLEFVYDGKIVSRTFVDRSINECFVRGL